MRFKKLTLSEKQIEDQILGWLKMKGYYATKIKTTGTFDVKLKRFRKPSPWYRKGVADIVVLHDATTTWLEVKSAKGRQSPEQKEFEKEVHKTCNRYFVVRSIEDVASIFGESVK